jgi:hypothetical protein
MWQSRATEVNPCAIFEAANAIDAADDRQFIVTVLSPEIATSRDPIFSPLQELG